VDQKIREEVMTYNIQKRYGCYLFYKAQYIAQISSKIHKNQSNLQKLNIIKNK